MRMGALFDETAPRRPVNPSLNSDLVAKARSCGLNLSGIAEAAIRQDVARERFAAEVRRSVDHHDAHVAEFGTLWEAVQRSLAEEEAEDGPRPR
jgi:post-segregation antitoxin (ccd killing protein)